MSVLQTSCPICSTRELHVFLERRSVPVHQNLPHPTQGAARSCRRGDLELAHCGRCGFVTNVAFCPELLEYGDRYENDQAWSPTFEQHVDSLVSRLVDVGLRPSLVAEVGCGNGRFLRLLCARGGSRGIGFDPSYVGPETADDGKVRFVREYFGPGQRYGTPDAVVCRHVIEHVPAPMDLLAAVGAALDPARRAKLFFETPDVDWILRGTVIQDFFYEHCSYFSASTLDLAFRLAGFSVGCTERLFGGQYLWLEGSHPGTEYARGAPAVSPTATSDLIERYVAEEDRRMSRTREALERLAGRGRTAVWGAGAKGVTFVNLFDPQGTLVECVVDINPKKQRMFVPGSAHAIVGPADVVSFGITDVIVMNPNYGTEIQEQLSRFGRAIQIHTEADL